MSCGFLSSPNPSTHTRRICTYITQAHVIILLLFKVRLGERRFDVLPSVMSPGDPFLFACGLPLFEFPMTLGRVGEKKQMEKKKAEPLRNAHNNIMTDERIDGGKTAVRTCSPTMTMVDRRNDRTTYYYIVAARLF